MVLVIIILAAGGIFLALHVRGKNVTETGSRYHISLPENQEYLEEGQDKTCTISIMCHTILDHEDSFDKEKLPYVPKDGVVLPTVKVSFKDSDTVFDVLKKVCETADIQLEYSWTPLYDAYYVEGINHLYEFDGGPESGWMYQVNGNFPNYGCSSYQLEGNENIIWYYTCQGLGEDVGSTMGASK